MNLLRWWQLFLYEQLVKDDPYSAQSKKYQLKFYLS